MPAYCTKADALAWVTQGSVTNPRRPIAAVYLATDMLVLDDHRKVTRSPVQLWLRGGGEMAEPLVEGTVYYAIRWSDSTFQVALTAAAAAAGNQIALTSEGCNMHLVSEIPWDAYIEGRSAKLDELAIGNALPLASGDAVPIVYRDMVSIQVLGDAMRFCGKSTEDLEAEMERVRQDLRDYWAKGKPLRAPEASASTNTAIRTPRMSGPGTSDRGWTRYCNGQEVIP
jgi:hypothetical protein